MSYEPNVTPESRLLTLNGDAKDLSADRTWVITPRANFIQTADSTPVIGTDPETTILGTGSGSLTIPANTLAAGQSLRIKLNGIYTTGVTGANMTLKVYLNSVQIAATAALPAGASVTKLGVWIDQLITFRSIGASGSAVPGGRASLLSVLAAGTAPVSDLNNAGAAVTVDTTVNQTLNIKLTWGGTANGTCSQTTTSMSMELITV